MASIEVYAFEFNDPTTAETRTVPFSSASSTYTIYVTCDTDLRPATNVMLNIRGPVSNFTLPLVVGTVAQDFGAALVPAGQWATRAITASDFPTKGRYELELLATFGAITRKSGILDLNLTS